MNDEAVFLAAWEAFRPIGAKMVRTRLRASAETVEDILGDVFVRAWPHRHLLLEAGANPPAWFARIAANLITDDKRRWRRMRLVPLPDGAEDLFPSPDADGYDATDAVLTLDSAARCLKPRQRAALLDMAADLTIDESAALRGQSAAAVKRLRWRATSTLRERLRDAARARGASRHGPSAAPASPAA